jgi:hypothetical protein
MITFQARPSGGREDRRIREIYIILMNLPGLKPGVSDALRGLASQDKRQIASAALRVPFIPELKLRVFWRFR